jgi:hypothetical protein
MKRRIMAVALGWQEQGASGFLYHDQRVVLVDELVARIKKSRT